jgi:hypothetical protein
MEVHGQNLLDVIAVQLVEHRVADDPCVVHQDIDPPERVERSGITHAAESIDVMSWVSATARPPAAVISSTTDCAGSANDPASSRAVPMSFTTTRARRGRQLQGMRATQPASCASHDRAPTNRTFADAERTGASEYMSRARSWIR